MAFSRKPPTYFLRTPSPEPRIAEKKIDEGIPIWKLKSRSTPILSKKRKQQFLKRDCVRIAHYQITKSLRHFTIPQVSNSTGHRIVRVCCRTTEQLQNIVPLLSQLMKKKIVLEVGMPLIYEHKMKSLVLFIKPTNVASSMEIEAILKRSEHGYHVSVKDIMPKISKKGNPLEAIEDSVETILMALDKNPLKVIENSVEDLLTEVDKLKQSRSRSVDESTAADCEESKDETQAQKRKDSKHSKGCYTCVNCQMRKQMNKFKFTMDREHVNTILIVFVVIFLFITTNSSWTEEP